MSIYTRRLGAGYSAEGASLRLYTTPAGGTVVVRDVVFGNQTSVAHQHFLVLQPSSGTGAYYLAAYPAVGAFETAHLELRQVLAEGDQLWWYSNGGPGSCMVTGYTFL